MAARTSADPALVSPLIEPVANGRVQETFTYRNERAQRVRMGGVSGLAPGDREMRCDEDGLWRRAHEAPSDLRTVYWFVPDAEVHDLAAIEVDPGSAEVRRPEVRYTAAVLSRSRSGEDLGVFESRSVLIIDVLSRSVDGQIQHEPHHLRVLIANERRDRLEFPVSAQTAVIQEDKGPESVASFEPNRIFTFDVDTVAEMTAKCGRQAQRGRSTRTLALAPT